MIYRRYINLFMLISVISLLGCSSPLHTGRDLGEPASIKDAPAPVVESLGEGLRVTARPLKPSVELGEPIYLAVRVTNMRQEPVRIIGSLRPGEGLIEIFSIHENGKMVFLAPLSEGDFSRSRRLASGQTIGNVFPLFFGANGWNFKAPGEYRIIAKFKVPEKEGFSVFSSEPVVIRVHPSEAGKWLYSAHDIYGNEAGKFLLWRSGDHLKAGMKHLMQVAERYPDSALSSYISAARVHNASEPFANYTAGRVRPPDCRTAGALRNKVKTDVLPENLLIEDHISQAKCHAESKRWREAKKSLDAGTQIAGDRPEFRGYAKSIAIMQKRLAEYLK